MHETVGIRNIPMIRSLSSCYNALLRVLFSRSQINYPEYCCLPNYSGLQITDHAIATWPCCLHVYDNCVQPSSFCSNQVGIRSRSFSVTRFARELQKTPRVEPSADENVRQTIMGYLPMHQSRREASRYCTQLSNY